MEKLVALPDFYILECTFVVYAHETDVPVTFYTLKIHQVVIDIQFHHVELDDQAEYHGGTKVPVTLGSLCYFQVATVSFNFPELYCIAFQQQALALAILMVKENSVLAD